MSAPYLVTGVVIPDSVATLGPPPSRLNIRDLKEGQPKQFTLFILSWIKIRDPDFQPKAASFQEIGGIHGMPYVPWVGDPDEVRKTDRGPWLGYCNHESILFPSWHRPYLLLLEQIISDLAHGIASEFASQDGVTQEEASGWIKAANELRFPFWDWTDDYTGVNGLPEFFTTDTIQIDVPVNQQQVVPNPLAFYTLNHPVDGFNNRWEENPLYEPGTRAYFREWSRTCRNPASQAVATDNYAGINDIITSQDETQRGTWANLRRDVAAGFGFPLDIPASQTANAWDEYSNTSFQSGRKDPTPPYKPTSPYVWNATTIEQPHNTVHLVVGGIGHMGDNDTAAFDPIFYLHHCNIDRLLAFWEHIYPDYVASTQGYLNPDGVTRTPFTQVGGGWKETSTQTVDDNTPLSPFRNSDYKYWTAQDTHSLNYVADLAQNKYHTYPPIVYDGNEINIDTDPLHPTSAEDREKQRRWIQSYFGYDPIQTLKKNPKLKLVSDIFAKPLPYAGGATPTPEHKVVIGYRQFFLSVSLDPKAIKGSHVLVVSINIRREGREDSTYEIGRVAVLSRGSSESCGNCQGKIAAGNRVRGNILVPHEAVASLLISVDKNRENTSKEEVITAIKTGISAKLALPNGAVHSTLQQLEVNGTKAKLSDKRAPYIELLSSDVYQRARGRIEGDPEEDSEDRYPNVPYDFKDWKSHDVLNKIEKGGETLEYGWVLGSA